MIHISSTKKERSLLRLKIFSKLEIKFYRIFFIIFIKKIYHKEISLLCTHFNFNDEGSFFFTIKNKYGIITVSSSKDTIHLYKDVLTYII